MLNVYYNNGLLKYNGDLKNELVWYSDHGDLFDLPIWFAIQMPGTTVV